jgi:hypothetical protein
LFYTAKKGQIWWVRRGKIESQFYKEASELPKMEAGNEFEMVENLHKYYGKEVIAGERYGHLNADSLFIDLSNMPSGTISHISMRKKPIMSGGHAIGVARLGDTYYVFDPNMGMYSIAGADRLAVVLKQNLTKGGNGMEDGNWADYQYSFMVTTPNIMDKLPG